ncbi:M48 family metallopeptidase [Draconibacterium sediminis]|uniref:tetratricopeptide repeat protein n=1 Tax=Draconibacterium sediminis TaxID=1544798 RepID=UPI0026EBB73B|nr:hypothetical protein [Draconibacterium sediminis]
MTDLRKILSFVILLGIIGCNSSSQKKENETMREGFDAFDKNQSEISLLIQQNPDSALVILDKYIDKYPQNFDFVKLRASLYFSTKDYRKCKKDIEKIMSAQPDTKSTWKEMIDYLNCKINTNGDCGDSLNIDNSENVITIPVD